jgi:hypothetical protein
MPACDQPVAVPAQDWSMDRRAAGTRLNEPLVNALLTLPVSESSRRALDCLRSDQVSVIYINESQK